MISKPLLVTIIAVIVVVVIGAIALVPSDDEPSGSSENKAENTNTDLVVASLPSTQGQLSETEQHEVPLNFSGAMVHKVMVTLSWTDDMVDTDPDEFELTLTVEGKTETVRGSTGSLSLEIEIEEGTSASTATVKLIDSGDGNLGLLGLIQTVDSGNDWTLETSFEHCGCCPPA